MILSARALAEHGAYRYSRPPGYPIHEALTALVVKGGAAAANGLVAAFSVVAFVAFARVLRHVGIRDRIPVALAMAFTPVVFVNSVVSLDYVVGLALALLAVDAVLRNRWMQGGVWLGLAVGARITWGGMLVPLAIWSFSAGRDTRGFLRLAGATVATGAAVFVPVFATYGTGFFTFSEAAAYPGLGAVLVRLGPDTWGTLGAAALAVALPAALIRSAPIRSVLGGPARFRAWRVAVGAQGGVPPGMRPVLLLAGSTVVFYLLVFLRLPHAAGYLVPVVPFLLLALAVLLPRGAVWVLCALLVLSSVVSVGRSGVSFGGPMAWQREARVRDVTRMAGWMARIAEVPQGSVVVAGSHLPALEVALGADPLQVFPEPGTVGSASGVGATVRGGEVELRYLVSEVEACAAYRRAGRRVYWIAGAADFNRQIYGVDLAAACGAVPLGAEESAMVER